MKLPGLTAIVSFLAPLLILITALQVNVRYRFVQELGYSGLAVLLLTFLYYRWKGKGEEARKLFQAENLFHLAFVFGAVIPAISYPQSIDIPFIRPLIRVIYYSFLAFYVIRPGIHRRTGDVFFTLLLFSSFLFQVQGESAILPTTLYILFSLILAVLRNREPKDPIERIQILPIIAFGIILVVFFFSSYFSSHTYRGMEAYFRWVGGSALVLWLIVVGREGEMDRVFQAAFLYSTLFLLFAFTGIYYSLRLLPDFTPFVSKPDFLAGINTNDLAGYILLWIPLQIAYAFRGEVGPRSPLKLVPVAGLLLLFATFARSAFPIPLVFVLVFFFHAYQVEFRRLIRWAFLRYTILLLVFLGIPILIFSLLLHRNLMGSFLDTRSLGVRIIQWNLAWETIRHFPIFGIGGDQFSFLYTLPLETSSNNSFLTLIQRYRSVVQVAHAHNTLLQIVLDGGISLFLAFFLFIFGGITRSWRRAFYGGEEDLDQGRMDLAPGVSLVGFLLHGLLNYTLFSTPVSILFFLVLGMALGAHGKRPVGLTSRSPRKDFFPFLGGIWIRILSGVLVVWISGIGILHLSFSIFRYEAIRSLLPFLYVNNLHSLVLSTNSKESLVGGYPISIPDDLAGESQSSLEKAAWFYPGDAGVRILLGDLLLHRYSVSRESGYLEKARVSYWMCLSRREQNPYCYLRLAGVASLEGRPEVEKTNLEMSRTHDPFRMLERENTPVYSR